MVRKLNIEAKQTKGTEFTEWQLGVPAPLHPPPAPSPYPSPPPHAPQKKINHNLYGNDKMGQLENNFIGANGGKQRWNIAISLDLAFNFLMSSC